MAKDSSSSTTCTACGAQASGKFCAECGTSLSTSTCRECGHQLSAGARFCSECGASSSGRTGRGQAGQGRAGREQAGPQALPPGIGSSAARYLPWGIAAVALLAVSVYLGTRSDTQPVAAGAPAAPFAPFANGGGGGGTPPDLSSMTPRERASRLYDRIMRYSEQGKTDSLQIFAPMAMASFELLGADLDLDARYDYGRVAAESGQLDVAAAQADTILQRAPTHLLGLALRARTATARGDAGTASAAWASFIAAKEAELKKNIAEYQMHAVDIEQATALAKQGK